MESIDAQQRFEEMYRRTYSAVLAYCLRRFSADTARDVVAEVYLVAWRRFDDLPDAPLPWLIKTASLTTRSMLRTDLRQDRLAARIATVHPPGAVPDVAEGVAQRAQVWRALNLLTPGDRELLILTAWDDLDTASVAAVLDCTQIAVRVRLHRARRRFSVLLHDNGALAAMPAQATIAARARECS